MQEGALQSCFCDSDHHVGVRDDQPSGFLPWSNWVDELEVKGAQELQFPQNKRHLFISINSD